MTQETITRSYKGSFFMSNKNLRLVAGKPEAIHSHMLPI
ncbi:hypothetical protein SeseC_01699 [Streptococcus equi subsp. zooepidemicus ATCC 35246]|nr:hypothetical protein SeseC_01699 [Streptococcus equi subsp. zooepidemicus ATCC 35246]